MKRLRKKLVAWIGPSLTYWTIKGLNWTMKFEEVHPETPRSLGERGIPGIGAFWHGRLLMMPLVYKGKKLSFLVSPHRDGQIVGEALKRFGFHAILGSTNRKGFSAFKQMLKANLDGSDIALTPDGPKGPRYQAQIGVIELAKLTGRPIIPVTFSASRRKMFKTWDQFLLPYPFSKAVFIWGEPIEVDPKGDRAHLEERRALLERRLNELTEKADHYFDPSTAPKPLSSKRE
ncbi:MAG TPA: lysophospholipid acyltransferase family protein [Thermodesulfobacteriota bacterium]|nr:lysophospholipid acyltransferase family protein [Thermodesulfobacteriota bacterium]